MLICTDGAALKLHAEGFQPDLIIGDMDSIYTNNSSFDQKIADRFPLCKIKRIPDQDTTDFEKLLIYLSKKGIYNVLCLGTFGKAMDHSFHNLYLIYKYSHLINLLVLHTYGVANTEKRQWIFPLKEKMSLKTKKGAIISFFPLASSQLSTKGLKWNLEASTLSPFHQHSVRNETEREMVEIHCKGPCLCFLIASCSPLFLPKNS